MNRETTACIRTEKSRTDGKRCGESRRSGKKGVNYYERGYDLHQP